MSTTQRVVRKQLAGAEDILQGVGTVTQTRGSGSYSIHKLDIPIPTYDIAEMQASSAEFMRLYGTDTAYTDYRRNPNGTIGIPSNLGGVWEPMRSSEYLVCGNFAAGAYVFSSDCIVALDQQSYNWQGSVPKVVAAGATPETSGGIGAGAWISWFDPELRIQVSEALLRSYAEAGYNLVDGSFEAGGTLVNANDVLLHESSGKAYSGPAGKVNPNTDPSTGGFVDVSLNVINSTSRVYFSSISEMKANTRLKVGMRITVGLSTRRGVFDISYIVKNNITADGYGDHQLQGGLVAELVHNGELKVEWFGVIADDISKAVSNVEAMKACVLYSFNKKPFKDDSISPWSLYNPLQYNTPILFSAGDYIFDGNSPLRPNPDDLLDDNKLRRGLLIRGAGKEATALTMLGDRTGSKNRWFYDTEAYSNRGGVDFLSVRDCTLRSERFSQFDKDDKQKGPAWNSVDEGKKVGAFNCYATGFEKFFDVENVCFAAMDTVIKFDGTVHGASNHFRSCYFVNTHDAVLEQSNGQSIANTFDDCDIEHNNGDVFKFKGKGGGYLNVYGGSIIMDPKFVNNIKDPNWTAKKAVFNFSEVTGTINLRGSKHMMQGVTFEVYDDLTQFVVYDRKTTDNGGAFSVTAEDCSWHTVYRKLATDVINPVPPTDPAVDFVYIQGNVTAEVIFRGSHLHSHYKYTMLGATDGFAQHSLVFESCRLLWNPLSNRRSLSSLVSASDSASARGEDIRSYTESVSTLQNLSTSTNDFDTPSKHSTDPMPPKIRRAMVKCKGRVWSGTKSHRTLMPTNCYIDSIRVSIPATAGTGQSMFVVLNNGLDQGAPGYVEYWRSPAFKEVDGYSKLFQLDTMIFLGSDALLGTFLLGLTNTPSDPNGFVSVTYTG